MLSVLMQVFSICALVMVIWVTYGYSLAFNRRRSAEFLYRRFSKAFLAGVTPSSVVETFSQRRGHSRARLHPFQMTFACITPALIVGAFAERIKFSPCCSSCAVGHLRLLPGRAHGLVVARA